MERFELCNGRFNPREAFVKRAATCGASRPVFKTDGYVSPQHHRFRSRALFHAETVSAGVAVVSPQVDAQTNLLFPQIVDLPPWWTRLALLNANPRGTATVKLYAMNPDGS